MESQEQGQDREHGRLTKARQRDELGGRDSSAAGDYFTLR